MRPEYTKTEYLKKITCAALLIGCLTACEEQEPAAFENIEGIYFNNRANISSASALLGSTNLTFVYENSDEMEVPVRIQLLGRPASQARPIEMRVTSDDAVEGVDYVLPQQAVMPAEATTLDYVVTLKRTAALQTASKTISLEILPNEYFSLPVTEEVQANGDIISTVRFSIIYSDMFTTPPVAWEKGLLGEFSPQKFNLICKVLNINPADFNDETKMTLSLQLYIYSSMTKYIDQEIAKRDRGEAFDSDVLDSETGEPLSYRYTED